MKSYGKELHKILTTCMGNHTHGRPYSVCSQSSLNKTDILEFWVVDYFEKEGCKIIDKKVPKSFKVEASKNVEIWCVCVDGCLIKDSKGFNPSKCDNLIFSEETFYFVEAKINVIAKWNMILKEIEDAIHNKIKYTKEIIFKSISDYGDEFLQKDIRISIPFKGNNYSVPRNNFQRLEQLRRQAEKSLKIPIKRFLLDDKIVFVAAT